MEKGILNCGVPQGAILGPMLLLVEANDMKTTLKNCDLWPYTDDTSIFYSHQNVKFIERNLDFDFKNLCELFIDNKFSTYFGEDKTFFSKE